MSKNKVETETGEETGAKTRNGGRSVVTITINDVPRSIHRGRQTVSDLKTLGEVPQADELEQLIKGKLTPLTDDGAVTIKGEEVFVSHPKDSGSSSPGRRKFWTEGQ